MSPELNDFEIIKSVLTGWEEPEPTEFASARAALERIKMEVAELERLNLILISQRNEYRECCFTLHSYASSVMVGQISVPEDKWNEAFEPLFNY